MPDQVELLTDGRRFSGWSSITVQRSLEAIAGSFKVAAAAPGPFPIRLGAECSVLVNGTPLVTGYVDAAGLALDKGRRSFDVAGRDRTAALVDCSAVVKPGEWTDASLVDIVQAVANPLGVSVSEDGFSGPLFPRFALQPGESAFELIERACRLRGLMPLGNGEGVLVIGRPHRTRAGVRLVEGQNVQEASQAFDDSARFRRYLVRGQRQDAGADVSEDTELDDAPEGEAFDLGVREERVLLITAEGQASETDCRARAQWEAAVRKARARKASVKVTGWTQREGGPLWLPGQTVLVRVPSIALVGERLVNAVGYTFETGENGGMRAVLELVPFDAWLPMPTIPKPDQGAEFEADVAENAGDD